MKRATLKIHHFVPKAFVIPRWLRRLPPFSELVYCERTYSNDYTSNTFVIVCLIRREPLITVTDYDVCRAVVYTGSTMQTTCLGIKSVFSTAFWRSVIQDAKHGFELHK